MFKATLSIFMVRAATIGLRILQIFVASLWLTPTQLGSVVFSYAIVEVVRVLVDMGGDFYLYRLYMQDAGLDDNKARVGTMLWVKLIVALICFMLVLVYLSTQSVSMLLASIISSFILSGCWLNAMINKYIAANKMRPFLLWILTYFTASCIGFAILGSWVSCQVAFAFAVLAELLLVVYIFIKTPVFKQSLAIAVHKPTWDWVATVLPIGLLLLLGMVTARLDVFYLKTLVTPVAFGLYAFAARLSELPLYIAAAFGVAVYGQVSRRLGLGESIAFKQLTRLYLTVMVFGAFVILSLWVFATFAVPVWFKPYETAGSLIVGLGVLVSIKGLTQLSASILQALGNSYQVVWVNGTVLVVGIFILPWLISQQGLMGAVYALIMLEILNLVLQLYVFGSEYISLKTKNN